MRPHLSISIRSALVMLILSVSAWAAEPSGVVVRADTQASTLTRERVIDLLSGRVATLPDGDRVVLIFSHGKAGEAAVKDLMGRDIDRLMRGWKRLVFGSGGSLPQTTTTDAIAIELAARTPNALLPLAGPPPENLPADLRFVPLP